MQTTVLFLLIDSIFSVKAAFFVQAGEKMNDVLHPAIWGYFKDLFKLHISLQNSDKWSEIDKMT